MSTVYRPIRLRFSYVLWHFTCAQESLFDLSPEELFFYKCIVAEAMK